MKSYAVIENGTVINVILSDSKEIAEEITQKLCIEYTEESPLAIGYCWLDSIQKYVIPSPFPSWTYSIDYNTWVPPITMPIESGKIFTWNEELAAWDVNDIVV